ncbi:hypothetical protein [Rhodopseudomonas faecalis]|uniref:hypothetical protein n=1 Tax=Rhodopseudomonas faecalis TaxID=99655 RepID=UPI000DA1D240|nr:hypothetical protein [Rhodopseudomonas faecalis]
MRYADAFCKDTSTTDAGERDMAARRGEVVRVFKSGALCDVDFGDQFIQFETGTPNLVLGD